MEDAQDRALKNMKTSAESMPWLQLVVGVPSEMKGSVGAAMSRFLPSLMWQKETKENGSCLLKTVVKMDANVDSVISALEQALCSVEAKHGLLQPVAVDMGVVEKDSSCGGWQRQVRPGRVSRRLIVGPPRGATGAEQGQTGLVIEPREAFGDGNHPSTRLSLQLLDELLGGRYGSCGTAQGWVLDAGCGSGLLALGAAALGAPKVLAVDIDPRAIDAARDNLRLNPGPGSKVFLSVGDLSCAKGPFGLVLANLVPPVHERVYDILWPVVEPGGWLILSGFCQGQKDSVLRGYIENGAAEKALCLDQAWAGVLLHKPR